MSKILQTMESLGIVLPFQYKMGKESMQQVFRTYMYLVVRDLDVYFPVSYLTEWSGFALIHMYVYDNRRLALCWSPSASLDAVHQHHWNCLETVEEITKIILGFPWIHCGITDSERARIITYSYCVFDNCWLMSYIKNLFLLLLFVKRFALAFKTCTNHEIKSWIPVFLQSFPV